jgi:hypothetical protein
MIFGTFIYGERIYHECDILGVILYDFQISLHDLDSNNRLPDIYWALYRRNSSISTSGPIDETHTLVDTGHTVSGLLQIDLQDYNLKLQDDDYYITAWRVDRPDTKTNVYLRYFYQSYTDSANDSPYYIGELYIPKSGMCQGDIIEIEQNRWQMVTIPIRYGYWDNTIHDHVHDDTTIATIKNYIVDQIEDTYGVPAKTMIEVMNTYVGDAHKVHNYVCGVTIDSSEHNFPLAYIDGSKVEYAGIWVKSIHPTPFSIKWGIV